MNDEAVEKFVIIQPPNSALWVMLISWLIGYFSTGNIHAISRAAFITAGIIWSYEEIVHGANWFRRTLGVAVMITMLLNILKLA